MYECFFNDCYNLYTIKTNKFNNIHLEIVMTSPLSMETITYLSMLTKVLTSSSNRYKTKKEFMRKLESLYNLEYYADNVRIGNTILTSFIIDSIDKRYMKKGSIEDIIEFLMDTIFNSYIDSDEFNKDIFMKAKNETIEEINLIDEDYKYKSLLNAFEMIESTPRSYNNVGYIDILNEMTPKKLYEFYKAFINNAKVDMYIIGNLDMEEINHIIKKYSKFNCINNQTYDYYLDHLPLKKVKSNTLANTKDINFVEIYAFKKLTDYERDYVMPLFNLIWGSGSMNSILYNNLRGNESLCYNVQTIYNKYDRVLTIESLINNKNLKRVKEICKESLNEVKSGFITKEILDNAKKIIRNSLNSICDSPSKLIDNYIFKNIVGLEDIETRLDKFNEVTLNDIINISKKIKLISTYEGEN